MQLSQIPVKIPAIFANAAPGGNVTAPFPTAAQPSGLASWNTGFTTVNFTPVAGGGVPPWGKDFNGLFQICSAWLQWAQANAPIGYDSAFQATIGGYPAGAIVMSATTQGVWWLSEVDNNVTNPDAAGAGWVLNGSYLNVTVTGIGVSNVTVPAFCSALNAETWSGGGGASGGGSPPGSSGAGGGYAAGDFAVTPGATIVALTGAGGIGTNSGGTAGSGGTSSLTASVTLTSASGGTGGTLGPGPGGVGTVGSLLMSGQGGTDLDGVNAAAPGGCAPRGGLGGIVNAVGVGIPPTWPGGGGGCNNLYGAGQNGAAGGHYLRFQLGT